MIGRRNFLKSFVLAVVCSDTSPRECLLGHVFQGGIWWTWRRRDIALLDTFFTHRKKGVPQSQLTYKQLSIIVSQWLSAKTDPSFAFRPIAHRHYGRD